MSGLVDTLISGGPIVVVLLVLSFLSLVLIAKKTIQLSGVLKGEAKRENALDYWSNGDRKAALDTVAGSETPVDRVLRHAMSGLKQGRPRAILDDDLEWRGNSEVAQMNRHIRVLELIAMISPLLGLLGTVLGMIQSFQELALAEGAANASVLAGGIWQALLTTAAGLIVAIPAAIAATLLSSRVDTVAQRIEATVGRLFAIEDTRA
jgi:biopolymer transport protein ExbB